LNLSVVTHTREVLEVTATPEKASGTDDQRVPGRQIEFSNLALDLKVKASDVESKAAFHLGELTEAGLGSRSFLYEQINAGRLRAHKLGRKTIILKRDLDNWLLGLPVYAAK
jgi:excisionase family DNA binding protein